MTNQPGVLTPLPAPEEDIHILKLLPLGDVNADREWASCQEAKTKCRHFELDARFEFSGAWSGVSQLVEEVYLDLLAIGEKAIIEEHDYEVVNGTADVS